MQKLRNPPLDDIIVAMIEILHKDLLARIAKFQTKTSWVETPVFVPVVHPTRELISPARMYNEFNCKIIITNAYLLLKAGLEVSLHDYFDYPGTIMTDSGAYQLLVYGDVDTNPTQIIQFQETIGSDIAVILDVPTGDHRFSLATHAVAPLSAHSVLSKSAPLFFNAMLKDF